MYREQVSICTRVDGVSGATVHCMLQRATVSVLRSNASNTSPGYYTMSMSSDLITNMMMKTLQSSILHEHSQAVHARAWAHPGSLHLGVQLQSSRTGQAVRPGRRRDFQHRVLTCLRPRLCTRASSLLAELSRARWRAHSLKMGCNTDSDRRTRL